MTYGCNTSRQNYTGRKPGYFARDGSRQIWIDNRMSKECRYDRSDVDKGCDGCGKRKEAGNDSSYYMKFTPRFDQFEWRVKPENIVREGEMNVASICKVILIGHLGRDPENRYLPSGEQVTSIAEV